MELLVERRIANRDGFFKWLTREVVSQKDVYEIMKRGTPIHSFVIDICVRQPDFAMNFKGDDGDYGKGFMADLVTAYAGLVRRPEKKEKDKTMWAWN